MKSLWSCVAWIVVMPACATAVVDGEEEGADGMDVGDGDLGDGDMGDGDLGDGDTGDGDTSSGGVLMTSSGGSSSGSGGVVIGDGDGDTGGTSSGGGLVGDGDGDTGGTSSGGASSGGSSSGGSSSGGASSGGSSSGGASSGGSSGGACPEVAFNMNSGEIGTTGPGCFTATSGPVNSWGAYNCEGRTITINGATATPGNNNWAGSAPYTVEFSAGTYSYCSFSYY